MDRYDLAARSTNNGLWDWDLITSRIHYSPTWLSMLGCGDMELGSSSEEWFKRIHPEDLESVRSEIKKYLEKGSAEFEIQHRMLHQDGCYRWMSCRGIIMRDEADRAIRITGSHSNITAEKVVDTLTGLPNRLLLLDRLTRSIEKARKREDFLFAVLIIDLNLFESGINRLETANGNLLVVAAARRLETSLMTYDSSAGKEREHLVVRSGGEEFIALLDGLSEVGEAKKEAERLLNELSAPFEFDGHEVHLSAGIGIALSVTGYRSADEALRDADTALYRAKSFGKSRCEVFDTGILESTEARNQLEKDLQSALSRNELRVFYQPIVSLSTHQVVGFEALARWMHPTRGMILSKDFIPIAENNGIIIPLDWYVLEQACRQLKAWQENPRVPKDLWISANLSGLQFTQPSLVNYIRETLRATGLDPGRFVLELTERSMMENPEAARSLLMQLRVMGFRIGLDDFGTGCSSLAYLHQFPVDYLKIDISFVRSIESSTDTLEIIRTITALARQLGLHVIAEGIENSRQLELIRSLHCEYGQGFLFSSAVDCRQAEDLLMNGLVLQKDIGSIQAAAEKGGINKDTKHNPVSDLHTPRLARKSKRRWGFTAKRTLALAGLTALILFFLGGLIARLNHVDSPPVAHTDSSVPLTAVEKSGEFTSISKPEKASSPKGGQTATVAAVIPKQTEDELRAAGKSAAVYTYPVIHVHRLGSCKGILTVTQNVISYAPEKGKDVFEAKRSRFTFALNGDQLTIKAGNREYRFKSDASTKEKKQSRISKIYQSLTRLHPSSLLKKNNAVPTLVE